MRKLILHFLLLLSVSAKAQLVIDGATFFIQSGATVTVQGDITSNVSIQGTGLLQLKGTSLQNVDMGGGTIPNLELDNVAMARLLNSDTRIGNSMLLTNGKFQTGNLNLLLGPVATITGGSSSRFIWTNGTGQLKKELAVDISSFELPVGENSNYRPAYLTTSGSTYNSANVGVKVNGVADANLPLMAGSYINANWPVTKTGITGGTVSMGGQYLDPSDISGTEANLVGYFHNGTDWSSAGETHDASLNRISGTISSGSGSLTAINKFVLVGAKVFLQGGYRNTTGLMIDNLRILPFGSPTSNSNFPNTDPYRAAPYNSTFSHVNNPVTETITNASVVAVQSNTTKNVTDWVFVELRNNTGGAGVLETRSALVLKDGTITDMDGVSPVTFNNIPNGNYLLAVRHRNHLALETDPAFPRVIIETKSTAFTSNLTDFTTASDAQLFGTSAAYTTASHPTLGTVNLLWGANGNYNNSVRANGGANPAINDFQFLITDALSGSVTTIISNIYHSADYNMDGSIRANGGANPAVNDYQMLISGVLNGSVTIIIMQQL